MFWSPVVPHGYLTEHLAQIGTLELYINGRYASCMRTLQEQAERITQDVGNPFFRTLQIMAHLRNT